MIKALFFDLDGVIANLCESHQVSLNLALSKVVGIKFMITDEEHHSIYNGLPTRTKLDMLTTYKGLPKQSHKEIESLKQYYTIECIGKVLNESPELVAAFKSLKRSGYITACVSNSIPETIDAALYKIGIKNSVDFIVSNKTTINNKPSPSPYLWALHRANVSPWEALVFEDSDKGMKSAILAGCNLCKVDSPNDLSEEFIRNAISLYS